MRQKMISSITALSLLALFAGSCYASGGGAEHHVDSGVLLKDFLYRILNFAIVVAILVYFVRKPLANALSGRREEIAKALEEARKTKEEAEARFAEYDLKLQQASDEIANIAAAIKQEGELEKEKIIANAKQMAEQIEADAGKAAELEVSRAKAQLRAAAAELAVDLAEQRLKKNFTKEDDNRLIDEYMKKVGELH